MRLDTSQQMRTEMRLRMAPRMIQSMEILQLPIMALQERIEQELSENPVLVDLRESASPGEGEGEEAGATAVVEPEPESEPAVSHPIFGWLLDRASDEELSLFFGGTLLQQPRRPIR